MPSLSDCNVRFCVPAGEVYPERTVGLQQTPQLFWRDPAVVGSLALGLVGDAGATVPERGVPSVRLVPAPLRQRRAHPGEAGHEEVGIGPRLPGLHPEHSSSLAVAEILMLHVCYVLTDICLHIQNKYTLKSSSRILSNDTLSFLVFT